jgi:hypothetical protein
MYIHTWSSLARFFPTLVIPLSCGGGGVNNYTYITGTQCVLVLALVYT